MALFNHYGLADHASLLSGEQGEQNARYDPSDLLVSEAQLLPLAEILNLPPDCLLGVSTQALAALNSLGVQNVFDLAMSSIFNAAVQIEDAADNPGNAMNRFGRPISDLLKPGISGAVAVPDLRNASLDILAGIDGAATVQAALGVTTVRDLAVIDWSRKSSAGQTEAIGETEDLSQETSRNRSISEVTEAVAREAQSGFSHTESPSTTKQAGGSAGISIGPFGGGASASISRTTISADSYATSAGSCEVGASMLQNACDRTHQHAHAALQQQSPARTESGPTNETDGHFIRAVAVP